jgi:hypothetical protein
VGVRSKLAWVVAAVRVVSSCTTHGRSGYCRIRAQMDKEVEDRGDRVEAGVVMRPGGQACLEIRDPDTQQPADDGV